jgi:uncharacterized membrane protein YbaN (DUF454 family)
MFLKAIWIFLGCISLCLGVVGIFVPGLPTTPFILLTAYFFMKGSKKLHELLINNKILGPYILNYQNNKGLTKQQKIISISAMWIMIGLSSLVFIEPLYLKIVVGALGVLGTTVIWLFIPLAKK